MLFAVTLFSFGESMTAHARLVSAHSRNVSRRINAERLPTNTTSSAHPIHRWFNFIAGFSPEFVRACISMCDAKDGQLHVLDPFVGCGTASITARLLGHASTGYDPHPFFSAISEAKANSARYWPSLPQIESTIREGIANPISADHDLPEAAAAFLTKMFRFDDLNALIGARRALAKKGLIDNPLAMLFLSRMLDHCCFAATDGIYKAPTSRKRALAPDAALDRVAAMLFGDRLEAVSCAIEPRIFCKSSETMSELNDHSVDVVITSPPYLNNFDFAEMTRMYLYFWRLAGSWGEISEKVRSRLIVNTTTALKGHRAIQDRYRDSLPGSLIDELDKAVAQLAEKRSVKAGKKEYDFLVFPYLSQMLSVLRECSRAMRPGAPLHMMISDAALYGVHLPAPQWIAKIMEVVGFSGVECHIVRSRGHRWALDKREGTEGGLGEYYVFGMAA
jgi:DNA modification methylase